MALKVHQQCTYALVGAEGRSLYKAPRRGIERKNQDPSSIKIAVSGTFNVPPPSSSPSLSCHLSFEQGTEIAFIRIGVRRTAMTRRIDPSCHRADGWRGFCPRPGSRPHLGPRHFYPAYSHSPHACVSAMCIMGQTYFDIHPSPPSPPPSYCCHRP